MVASIAWADADEHSRRAGPHEVQSRGVRGAAPDDDGDVDLADEALQVERLRVLRDVLGGDDRALYHEEIELGGEHDRDELGGALWRDRAAGDDACFFDLANAQAD